MSTENLIGRRFIALKDFESKETRSAYAQGLGYTVRTPELAELALAWEKKGLIEFTDAPGTGVRGGN